MSKTELEPTNCKRELSVNNQKKNLDSFVRFFFILQKRQTFFSMKWLGEILNEFFGSQLSGNGSDAAVARWRKRSAHALLDRLTRLKTEEREQIGEISRKIRQAIIGILPYIADHFHIRISKAGWLVSLFALVVSISGPTMPLLFSGVNRKTAMSLVFIFMRNDMNSPAKQQSR